MLKARKEPHDGVSHVFLSGVVDENADFDALFGTVAHDLRVNCKEIERINSAGVRNWVAFFESLKGMGIRLTFQECSVAITAQLSMIVNFGAGGTIESICLPYACATCAGNFIAVVTVEKLKKISGKIPNLTCPKCGGSAVFDEIESDYLAFLSRS